MEVLLRMDDTACLRGFVLASASYHAIYRLARDKIFTAVTVNELTGRCIDILQPHDLCQVLIAKGGTWRNNVVLQVAMFSIYDHYRGLDSKKRASSPILSFKQNLELLRVQELFPWETERLLHRSNPEMHTLVAKVTKQSRERTRHMRVCCAERVIIISTPSCWLETSRNDQRSRAIFG